MTTTLLLDMDGPLADFDRAYFDNNAKHGITMDVTFENQRHRYASKHIPDEYERKAATDFVNAPGWFRSLPPTPFAIEGFHKLNQHFDVWICTKPLESNPTCRDEKAAWVVEHLGPQYERRLIITPDKSLIRGTILLDDAPKPEWLLRAMWHPVIFPAPWNGEGSAWQHLPRWHWNDGIQILKEGGAYPDWKMNP